MATKTKNPLRGTSNQNPPYRWMTQAKWDSMGCTMTVKQALNKWWNSIRVRVPGQGSACIYKCHDGWYEIDNLARKLKITQEEALKLKITLDDEYQEDDDDNPIIYATLAETEEKGGK